MSNVDLCSDACFPPVAMSGLAADSRAARDDCRAVSGLCRGSPGESAAVSKALSRNGVAADRNAIALLAGLAFAGGETGRRAEQ